MKLGGFEANLIRFVVRLGLDRQTQCEPDEAEAPVVALAGYAVELPSSYYGSITSPSAVLALAGEIRDEMERRLNELLARLRDEAPNVEVSGRLVEGAAASVLTKEGQVQSCWRRPVRCLDRGA